MNSIFKELYWTVLYCTELYWIVLYYWSSLRCIKNWVMINCRGLKYPHRAAVLLVLERDSACTGLNGRSARKISVLVLVWCYIAIGEREQDLQRHKPPESCIKKPYDKPSGYGCLSKNVSRGSNEAVTLLYHVPHLKHSGIQWKHKLRNFMIITTDHNPHCPSRQLCASFAVSQVCQHFVRLSCY